MKLFLIRHGQTTANLDMVYAGQTDVPLTDLGRQQAEAIRPILAPVSFDKIYSSDLSRAIDTQRLAIPGAEGIRTPLLREYDVGSLVGVDFARGRQLFAQAQTDSSLMRDYSLFGGESPRMVCDRIREFLSMLEAESCENVAAFVHNGIMNSMLRIVLGTEFDTAAVKSQNCAINIFEFDGTRWRLFAWNYMGGISPYAAVKSANVGKTR